MSEEAPAPSPLPGLVVAVVVMLVAGWLAGVLGQQLLELQGVAAAGKKSPISGISLSIILGLVLANTVGVPESCAAGLKVALKKVLKLGIILVGIRLSFLDVLQLGAVGIPVVLAIIVFALLVAGWLANRLELSDRLGVLAAASTAICGVTATVAVSSAIDAEEDEVAYTVANVTLFGMLAMLLYPYLANWVFGGGSTSVGLFLGTAIHDTAQVMGAALSYKEIFGDELALQVATVTKLTRNVFLVGVVPYLAYRHAKKTHGEAHEVRPLDHFPTFVLGFLAMAVLRTLGDAGLQGESAVALGFLDAASWKSVTRACGSTAAKWALGTAMAAVGLSTRLSAFKEMGLRPLYVGGGAALAVGGLAMVLAALAGPLVG